MASLNLQRNSEVFFSTVDILGTTSGSASVAVAMTPANTWKLEVLAGFAATSTSATQDITVDALRIEQIGENERKSMAAGAAMAVVRSFGHRRGLC